MNNKKIILVIGLSVISLTVLTFVFKKNQNLSLSLKTAAVTRTTAAVQNPVTQKIETRNSDSAINANVEIAKLPDESLKKLNNYISKKQKILMTDQEKQEKKKILDDQEFLAQLKSFLLNSQFSTADLDIMNQKNQALDLLLEANRLSTGEFATSLLKDIIEDNQIENTKLSMEGRQFFADMKAEILYELTSQSVDAETAQIEQLIRDPYTAKIWKNVQYAQEQNRLESLESN